LTHTQQGMQRYLTTTQKDRYLPFIIQRDGPNCFYCGMAFSLNDKALRRTYDHLNNDPKYNDPQNLVLAHWSCNQTKKYNQEYIIKASAKLRENKLFVDSLGVGVYSKPEPKQASQEIDINVAFWKITKDYISERLIRQGLPSIPFNETAYSVAYMMKDQTNHGSSATAKRYLLELCSEAAPFNREEQGGIWYIVKRQ